MFLVLWLWLVCCCADVVFIAVPCVLLQLFGCYLVVLWLLCVLLSMFCNSCCSVGVLVCVLCFVGVCYVVAAVGLFFHLVVWYCPFFVSVAALFVVCVRWFPDCSFVLFCVCLCSLCSLF